MSEHGATRLCALRTHAKADAQALRDLVDVH
jgi:hypothetical protein